MPCACPLVLAGSNKHTTPVLRVCVISCPDHQALLLLLNSHTLPPNHSADQRSQLVSSARVNTQDQADQLQRMPSRMTLIPACTYLIPKCRLSSSS
jgi:hypothetical protein